MSNSRARMSAEPIVEHACQAVSAAVLQEQPFGHMVVEEFLPPDVFAALIGALPELPAYERPERQLDCQAAACERAILPLAAALLSGRLVASRAVFEAVNQALLSAEVMLACLRRLGDFSFEPLQNVAAAALKSQVILSRDFPPYAIGPHTDIPKRLASMILYLAPNSAPDDWGTTLFVPKEAGFTCAHGQHYGFDGFIRRRTVPFRGNRALLFARNNRSFHGLLPIVAAPEPRDTLLYEIVRQGP